MNNTTKYRAALKRMFSTADGEIVKKWMYDEYVAYGSFNGDPYITAYNLGKQELVQDTISDSKIS